jgi:hypothetical protein
MDESEFVDEQLDNHLLAGVVARETVIYLVVVDGEQSPVGHFDNRMCCICIYVYKYEE